MLKDYCILNGVRVDLLLFVSTVRSLSRVRLF